MAIAPTYANSTNQIAALKELYVDDKDYMKNIVYSKNPDLAMIPKNESPDGFAGKYIPVPLEYGNPQGRAHQFANAQNQQTASSVISYFVYAVQCHACGAIWEMPSHVYPRKVQVHDCIHVTSADEPNE